VQNRKDLLQAHRLMTQRAGLALLQGEADTAEQPLRRINIATFAGVMVAALAVAVFWIIGAFTHSGAQVPRNASGTVIMDKDTGTSFVWCGGKLCPALNYASALLALGTSNVTVRGVSQRSLAGIPRGQTIGIPGLPPLPVPGRLIRGPWSVCVRTVATSTGQQPTVTLVAGRDVHGQPIGDRRAVLVRAQNQTWVIWHDQRMPIGRNYLSVATGGGGQQPIAVPVAWLNSLAEGPAFIPPAIPGFGQPTGLGPAGPATVGAVYKVAGVAATQWYVQLSDGVAQISQTQAALLLLAPGQKVAQAAQLSPQAAAQHPAARAVPRGGLPLVPTTPVSFDPVTPLCAVYHGVAQPGEVTLGGAVPAGGLAAAPRTGGANYVWLPPGAGALAGATTAMGQRTASTYFLVTGASRYALATPEVAADLGYRLGAQRTLVPVNILNLIPQGPVLDPSRARQTVTGG
jgi:type VII secretion protein EccB